MLAGTFRNKLKACGIRDLGKHFQQLAAPARYILRGKVEHINMISCDFKRKRTGL